MAYEKFKILKSNCVPLPIENIDTDQIIPARFLKATKRVGFGDNLFRDWKYNSDNTPKKEFVLNNKKFYGKILVGGKNFGLMLILIFRNSLHLFNSSSLYFCL